MHINLLILVTTTPSTTVAPTTTLSTTTTGMLNESYTYPYIVIRTDRQPPPRSCSII